MKVRFNNNLFIKVGNRKEKSYKIGDILEVDTKEYLQLIRHRCTLVEEKKETKVIDESEKEVKPKKTKYVKQKKVL